MRKGGREVPLSPFGGEAGGFEKSVSFGKIVNLDHDVKELCPWQRGGRGVITSTKKGPPSF